MSSGALQNINHVIVLMFENRSFDHILGAMPGVNGVLANGQPNPEIYNTMHPTQEPGSGNPPTLPTPIAPGAQSEGEYVVHDFNHEFGDGMLQGLFPGATGIIQSQAQYAPTGPPAPQNTYPATNSGFLSMIAWNADPSGQTPNGPGAMTYFEWGSMKVFHNLAENFVVCDAWHCDMPGHTAPNRAFMHCATTGGLGIDDDDAHDGQYMVNSKTIFEQIQSQSNTNTWNWKMYWQGYNCDTNYLNEQVLSQQYSPANPAQFNVTNVPISQFFADLTGGTLPFYSFIMCWNHSNMDTSMHPASAVENGENLLACVYNALQASGYWENTLLIVNFDENGGMYDHVVPPAAVAPQEGSPVSTWTAAGETNLTYSYDFTTLGLRTPVLLISPWLQAGIDSQPYQNTSILRFLQDMLPGPGPLYLTQRDKNAPSIASAFAQFGCSEMRTDCPAGLQLYPPPCITARQIQSYDGPAPEALAAPPAPHIERITKEVYLRGLPGHADSGKPITRSFSSVGEMRAYSQERLAAALAYIKAKRTP